MHYQLELQQTIFIMTSLDNMRRRFSLVSVVISAPLDEVIFPSQGLSLLLLRLYPFMNLGDERYCENKVTCPRPQGSGTERSRTTTPWSRVQHTNLWTFISPHLTANTVFFFIIGKKRCDWLGVIDILCVVYENATLTLNHYQKLPLYLRQLFSSSP